MNTLKREGKNFNNESFRLLSLYQSIWGTREWNAVSKTTIGKKPKEIMDTADKELKAIGNSKGGIPKSIRSKLDKIVREKKEQEEKEENNPAFKFLNALMKPYSELKPEDRLELYEKD